MRLDRGEGERDIRGLEGYAVVPGDAGAEAECVGEAVGGDVPALGEVGPVTTSSAFAPRLRAMSAL